MTPEARWILRLEGLVALGAAVWVYRWLGHGWLLFALLFLTPDLFMLGYLKDQAVGARVYNLGHTYLTPTVVAAIGLLGGPAVLVPIALIWAAHIGFDRVLGYGLKAPTRFKHTHLSGEP